MGQIFLSYAREDRGCVKNLAHVLEAAHHDVWWDRRLDGGEEFSAEIEAALDKSDVVVVAWSKESVKSRWVRDEAAVGGDTGRLVPVSIDGSLPPMGFRQFHTLDLTDWKGGKRDERTAELLHSVERRLKDKGATASPSPAARPIPRSALPLRRWLWPIIAAFVLLVGAGTAFFFATREQTRSLPQKPMIALLPFTAATPDAELRNIAAQARDSVSHTLSRTGMPVRLADSASDGRRSVGDFLLSGEVSKSADTVIATVHLDEAIHGVTVFTERFEASGDDVRNLPERIGVHMASFFDGSTLMMLDRRHPMDPALIADLASARAGDFAGNYQIMKRVAAKAPDEPAALTGQAFFTGLALSELPRDERQQAVIEARRAAEKALKLAPGDGGTYASWCLLHSETRMAECEDQIRRGSRINPDEAWTRQFLADAMWSVGRFDEASELANLAYTRQPYDFFMIRTMLRTFEFAGDSESVRELYPEAVRWYPGLKASFFRNRLYGLLYRGDFAAMQRLEDEVGPDAFAADYTRSGRIVAALKSKSQPALRKVCAPATREEFLLGIRCLIAFGTIGDLDGAYAIADKFYPRRIGRTPEETERIWLNDPDDGGPLPFITSPAAAPMRRDPRYLALAERTGLLAYWRSGRPPDFCRRNPEPVCRELLRRNR